MNKGQLLRRNNRSLKSTLMIKHVNHFVDNVSAFIWTKLSIGRSPYNKIDTMGILASEILKLKCPLFEAKDLDGRMYSVQKPSSGSNQVFYFTIPVFAPCLCLCHCLCICLCLRFVCTILLYLQTPAEHSVLPKTPEEGWLAGWLVTGCSLKAIRRCYPKMLSTHFAGILSLATTAILLEMRLEICTRDSRVQFLT